MRRGFISPQLQNRQILDFIDPINEWSKSAASMMEINTKIVRQEWRMNMNGTVTASEASARWELSLALVNDPVR